jgi:hypothetical protein
MGHRGSQRGIERESEEWKGTRGFAERKRKQRRK